MEQAKPKLKVNWVMLGWGVAIGGASLWGTKIDVLNNYTYGLTISSEAANGMALAALSLSLVPAHAAYRKGWDTLHVLGTVIFAFLTFWAAANAYMARQGEEMMAAQSATSVYEDARRAIVTAEGDLKAAQVEASAISEQMGSKELQALYDAAKDLRDKETSKERGSVCGKNCRAAERDMQIYLPRVATARAKEIALQRGEDARARLGTEKARAVAGPKETGQVARYVAARFGWDAGETERNGQMIGSLGLILATIIAACFMHHAAHNVIGAFALEQPKTVRGPYKAKQVQVAEPSPTPEKVLKGLPGFLAQCAPGDVLPVKDVAASLESWWRATKQAGAVPTSRALGMALVKAGFDKNIDRQKRVSYAIKLPAAAPRLVAVA